MQETYDRLHAQITERGPWQHTSTGAAFFLGDPRPEEVDIHVIARALSRLVRYNGHYAPHVAHYSVAQHAVLVARWMYRDNRSMAMVYAGLHHDDAEAYVGDNISQMKKLCPEIKVVEKKVEAAVFAALGVDQSAQTHTVVKEYDFIACATEVRDIMPPNHSDQTWGNLPDPRPERITPWTADHAYHAYMETHFTLVRKGGLIHD